MLSSSRALLARCLVILPFAVAALAQLDCSAGSSTSGTSGTGGAGGSAFATTVTVTLVGAGQVDAKGKAGTKTCIKDGAGTVTGDCTSHWGAGDPPTLTATATAAGTSFQLWADGTTGETLSTKPSFPVKEGDALAITALFSSMSTTTSGGCDSGPACCPSGICPDVVVDKLPSIAGLVEQGSDLYYFGSVEKIAKTGGAAKEIVGGSPGSFAVDASSVYWVDSTAVSLWKADHDGGGTTKLASLDGKQYPHALALDATDIYMTWLANKGGTDCPAVVRIPKAGGAPTVVSTSCDAKPSKPYAIALNDTHVFLGTIAMPTGGALTYAPKDGADAVAVQLTAGQNTAVTRIVVDGNTVFYLLNGLLMLDVNNPSGATHVDTMLTNVAAFVVDKSDIVMVGSGGVARIDRATQKESFLAYEPGSTVAIDATTIYWGSGAPSAAKILKIAR
ncbi:MAG: hypothetical protein ABI193_06280 [Minicystis sp.]